MRKRKISFVYRLVIITSLLVGLILNFANTASIRLLISYYTMQSNIFCLFVFIGIQIAEIKGYRYRRSDLYYAIKGMITIAILVTGLVYIIALVPNNMPMYTINRNGMTSKAIGNVLVHIISPILVISDYFLFDQKGNFKWFYPFLWLFFQLQYILYVFSYRATGGRFYSIGGSREFAYFFLDYKQMGKVGVVVCVIGIALVIVAIGLIWVLFDKFLKNKRRKNKTSRV